MKKKFKKTIAKEILKVLVEWEGSRMEIRTANAVIEKLDEMELTDWWPLETKRKRK